VSAVTRLAPSPTGALHLGNARTFVINFLLARQAGWRVLMRVEDLDGPRVRPGADEAMLDELRWLGLEWDGQAVYQSQRGLVYQAALDQLISIGAAYPCVCSRRDVELAAGAPHDDEAAAAYPGTCRGRFRSAAEAREKTSRPVAWRVHVPRESVRFVDEFAGPRSFDLGARGGDFVVFKNDGLAAYQLAVVVDDASAGVDAVVRGDDLLESAARQIHIRRLLGLSPGPSYWHLPLVVGPDGRRLAKRHGDTRLGHYRGLGVGPERILGLIGYWSGVLEKRREAGLKELLERFDMSRLPRERITFTRDDEMFLTGGPRGGSPAP